MRTKKYINPIICLVLVLCSHKAEAQVNTFEFYIPTETNYKKLKLTKDSVTISMFYVNARAQLNLSQKNNITLKVEKYYSSENKYYFLTNLYNDNKNKGTDEPSKKVIAYAPFILDLDSTAEIYKLQLFDIKTAPTLKTLRDFIKRNEQNTNFINIYNEGQVLAQQKLRRIDEMSENEFNIFSLKQDSLLTNLRSKTQLTSSRAIMTGLLNSELSKILINLGFNPIYDKNM